MRYRKVTSQGFRRVSNAQPRPIARKLNRFFGQTYGKENVKTVKVKGGTAVYMKNDVANKVGL
jgi:hypothetical protein